MDPLGNPTYPQTIPAPEHGVKEELVGWYTRLCERNAADARKELSMRSMKFADGSMPMTQQFQAGEAQSVHKPGKDGLKRQSVASSFTTISHNAIRSSSQTLPSRRCISVPRLWAWLNTRNRPGQPAAGSEIHLRTCGGNTS